MKQWYPINSFFFGEEIRYVHDGFILRNKIWLCAMMDGRDIECMAGPETIQSRPLDWSSGLAILFVSLRPQDPPHQSGNQSCHSMLGSRLAVWLKVASPFFSPCPTLLASAARKETNIALRIFPHYIASRQRGQGLLSSQRFRCSS